MVTAVKTWADDKDKNVRVRDGGPNQGNGLDEHLIVGRKAGTGIDYQYRAYLHFVLNWTDVRQIVDAYLVLMTTTQVHTSFGTKPKTKVQRITTAFTQGNAGEGVWDPTEYEAPHRTLAGLVIEDVPHQEQVVVRIKITDIVEEWAPVSVARRNGLPGGALPQYGLGLYGGSETDIANLTEYYSRQHSFASKRPYIELTYEKGNQPPQAPVNGRAPLGDVTSAPRFTGNFEDPDGPTDQLSASHIRMYEGTTLVWEATTPATASEVAANAFSVPVPALVRSGVDYLWEARCADLAGSWSPWSAQSRFSVTNDPPSAPTLSPASGSSYATLAGVQFRGTFSDPDSADSLGQYHIQLRVSTPDGDPAWNGNDHLWDTGAITPTSTEVGAARFSREYGGKHLDAATYSWRGRVADNWGSWGPWSYASITLATAFDPDPGSIDFLTNYGKKQTARVRIKPMAANRGPHYLDAAVIYNPAGLGASKYLNSPGEFHMTLPATHEQVSVIEPYQTHYAVEVWHGDRWRECFAGLITDFDASEDEVIFYGIDYLGLLSMMIDGRYNATKGPDWTYTEGGSHYSDVTISAIIINQLDTAIAETYSPVGFISKGHMDTFSERVTIYSTFVERLSFISGLIDSHRQGTGKRSRLWVNLKAALGPSDQHLYEFLLYDDPGQDRDNLRLEYGGLIQNFQIVTFGDFAAIIHGIGRPKTGTLLTYKTASAPGVSPSLYGAISKVGVYTDINDEHDLERRVKQAAATAGRVGKRVGLALKIDAIQPFDGYDIGDNVPVHIQRGVVDTTRYGSGYWSIMGVEFTIRDDGSQATTLVLLPKEDGSAPDPDLIPSAPILSGQAEWRTGEGVPVTGSDSGSFYIDTITGKVYERQPDGTYTEVGLNAASLNPGIVTDEAIDPAGLDAGNLSGGTLDAPVDIDASAITEGALPGGHNAILNSSFELADFGALASVVTTWTASADWTASRVGSDTNVTTGANALTEAGMTY